MTTYQIAVLLNSSNPTVWRWLKKHNIPIIGSLFIVGIPKTESCKKKLSLLRTGSHHSEGTKLKISKANTGRNIWTKGKKRPSISQKAKERLANPENHPMYGKHHSKETRIKSSKSHMGQIPYNKGKKTPEEIKSKISLSHGGTGIPHENDEYGADFDSGLKESVRFRDGYKCKLCGCPQIENEKQLDIHHIDSNKKNNKKENLVALCKKCHAKMKFNRKYWENYFLEELSNLYLQT